jgi:hypothetical protein
MAHAPMHLLDGRSSTRSRHPSTGRMASYRDRGRAMVQEPSSFLECIGLFRNPNEPATAARPPG